LRGAGGGDGGAAGAGGSTVRTGVARFEAATDDLAGAAFTGLRVPGRLAAPLAGRAAERLGRDAALRAGAFFCFDRTLLARRCFANPYRLPALPDSAGQSNKLAMTGSSRSRVLALRASIYV